MASFEKDDKSGLNLGEGILMPIIQNRWRLRVQYDKNIDGNNLSKQVVICDVDLKNNTIRVEAEENCRGEVSEILNILSKVNRFKCNIDALSGAENIYFSNEFIGCKIMKHSVKYDYANSGVVTHVFTICFDDFRILMPENRILMPEKS